MITLPLRRMSRPFVVRMMSSTWSHGTSRNCSVTLLCTESLTTMFTPPVSASNCSTARVAMS